VIYILILIPLLPGVSAEPIKRRPAILNKLFSYLILLTLIVITLSGCHTGQKEIEPDLFEPMGKAREEQIFGEYSIKIYEINDSSFEILKNGVRVYSDFGHRFEIGSIYENDETGNNASVNGNDITGDGYPNLIVSEWTGGVHCCFLFHIFEIGPDFQHIQTINAAHGDLSDFENMDDDPDLEFFMADWTFAYWRVSFSASPAPEVILKYNGKKYELANDLMRAPGLSRQDLDQLASEVKSWFGWQDDQPPSILWAEMLNLIYTGNMAQAWDLLDLSWPAKIEGKEQFLKDFRLQLKKSPFWKSILKLNNR